jgi:ABC-2 type transport system permease protein
MTAILSTDVSPAARRTAALPFWRQVTALTWRNLVTIFRVPAEIIPALIISAFFLLVYKDSFGGAANFLPGLAGKSYLAFTLPLSIISAALSGAGVAGQAIVRDIATGYFNKLLLTPVSRVAILLGAMIAGAFVLLLQTSVVMGMGLILGLQPETGALGILGVLGIAMLVGVGFSGVPVAVALLTGSAGATQGISFLFFPLSFLTSTFVPLSLLTGWVRTVAEYNPITYILDAMRSLLLEGWQADVLGRGLLSCLLFGALGVVVASWALRQRTRLK